MIFYGTHRCPDCEEAQRQLQAAGMDYEYVNIFASTANMKEFLALRDERAEFAAAREAGGIGIPCFYFKEENRVTLNLEDVILNK